MANYKSIKNVMKLTSGYTNSSRDSHPTRPSLTTFVETNHASILSTSKQSVMQKTADGDVMQNLQKRMLSKSKLSMVRKTKGRLRSFSELVERPLATYFKENDGCSVTEADARAKCLVYLIENGLIEGYEKA